MKKRDFYTFFSFSVFKSKILAVKPYFALAIHKDACFAEKMLVVSIATNSHLKNYSTKHKNNPTERVFVFFNPYKTVRAP